MFSVIHLISFIKSYLLEYNIYFALERLLLIYLIFVVKMPLISMLMLTCPSFYLICEFFYYILFVLDYLFCLL